MKRALNYLILAAWMLASAAQAQTDSATPAPPPAAPPQRSAAELEKLVAPIALYPDPLIAAILPASVYPLEIVQAARFMQDTNNLAKLDDQPWDENVREVARVPDALKKLNDDLSWTIELGKAFLDNQKDVMDMIQSLRLKAQKAGTLQTSPQQIVIVTNTIIEKTVEQQVIVVTNTIVQIQPSNPQVIYVPTYNPYTVYYPPPAYVYNPYAPLITFGVAVGVAAIWANNCDWHHGGVYVGHHGVAVWGGGSYHGNVNINNNVNVNNNYNQNVNNNNNNNNNNNSRPGNGNNNGGNNGGQNPGGGNNGSRPGNSNPGQKPSQLPANSKWQPDQNRMSTSGAGGISAGTSEARGWSSSGAKPSTGNVGARPSTGNVGTRPTTGNVGTRPSTGAVGTQPSTGNAGARPSTGQVNSRPSTGAQGGTRPTTSAPANRPAPSTSPSQSSANRGSSSGSAFSGVNSGSSARSASSRGSSSRSSGGFSGGSRGGGGGGRGGGGRR